MIFGNAKASFTPEWRKQGFSFCDLYGLEYGIVHLKVSLCLFQLVSLSQLSDFPANKRLVTVSKIFEKRPAYWRFHTIIKGLKYNDLCLRATAVSEEEARDALLCYVAEHCCFCKGAARDMEIEDVTASSAYHVSHSARISYFRMISLSYSGDLEKVRVLL